MTCWDKRELCDLNCVFATTHSGDEGLAGCSTSCVNEQNACVDSPETVAYVSVRWGRSVGGMCRGDGVVYTYPRIGYGIPSMCS